MICFRCIKPLGGRAPYPTQLRLHQEHERRHMLIQIKIAKTFGRIPFRPFFFD